ncbi:hypothetical protein RhiXN_04894 [Rhizoctonia solani]|uniref:Uncharacterized protein n=1 Tax=Rhizoctonia solani TaxID=456999 RepID=A0A8H8NRF0_9AGAM|nr:uncharacterized protein RhiXN_04894 [Rhizoctonia solani]QRW16892.1 hypothetical protein RhiXN_04894 [Rhizoctonia solani]
MFTSRQLSLLLALLFVSGLGTVCGGPIQNKENLVARQVTTATLASSTQVASPTTLASQTTLQSSATSVVLSSAASSSAASATTTRSTTIATSNMQSSTTTQITSTHTSQLTATTSDTSSLTSAATSSTSGTSTSTSTSASTSATATASVNIFDKSSPYFGYFCPITPRARNSLDRPEVQQEADPSPITANAGAWRYSEDTELYSPSVAPNSASNTMSTIPLARHKGLGAEMGEAQAFLSTESVTLYPPAKYTEEETGSRRHSRSLSNALRPKPRPCHTLQQWAWPFGRGRGQSSPRGISEGEVDFASPGQSMPSMLIARAGHSDAYRQPTIGSTSVSRASTASVYSQPSGIHTPPPMPELPPLPTPATPRAQAQPRPQSRDQSPDVEAELLRMANTFTDTIPGDESVHSQDNNQPAVRQTPGRMGWGRQAPSSVHSHSDLFFNQEQR